MLPGIRRTFIAGLGAVTLLTACGASGDSPPPQAPPSTQAALDDQAGPPAPNGRRYPRVPELPTPLGRQLGQVEEALASDDLTPEGLAALAHRQQVLYRRWSLRPEWDSTVLAALPAQLRPRAERQVGARREFLAMHRRAPVADRLPAWRILTPLPADQLQAAYRRAEKATGIDWATLAAINLVETGMGRLQGLSVAGARGPMQFLPSTWAEAGIGKGSIDNPEDAIAAAGRYLVRRGGRQNLPQAIWGYNNSWHYVRAVQTYADLMRDNPRAFRAFHAWQIHYASPSGDLWLPEGTEHLQPLPVAEHLRQAPWSAPPAR
ncbi:MAG: transglycosylase SLT domain-containing protein [Cyanobacteriota bacterium]|nr:transglycosylase SLT domain-containing protein [Cyanobacteriota bacterium]